ncbi:hypothetical protein ACWENQ_45140 [Nonomuraea sp. NPDC004354]|uniref:hypothetical protein n=1 Tax=Nonomuraea sp. NPDC003804 TaxID=3154547 RepID=UPI00339E1A6A
MRKIGALVAGGLLAAGMTALPGAASAQQALTGKVVNTAGLATFEATTIGGTADGEVYRINFGKRPVGWYAYGDTVHPVCWLEGPKVTGPYGSTTAWISLGGGYGAGGDGTQTVLTDAWVNTGDDIRRQIRKCANPGG